MSQLAMQALDHRATAHLLNVERLRHAPGTRSGLAHRRPADECSPLPETGRQACRGLHGQTGFADSAWPEQRDQSRLGKRAAHQPDRLLTPHELLTGVGRSPAGACE